MYPPMHLKGALLFAFLGSKKFYETYVIGTWYLEKIWIFIPGSWALKFTSRIRHLFCSFKVRDDSFIDKRWGTGRAEAKWQRGDRKAEQRVPRECHVRGAAWWADEGSENLCHPMEPRQTLKCLLFIGGNGLTLLWKRTPVYLPLPVRTCWFQTVS